LTPLLLLVPVSAGYLVADRILGQRGVVPRLTIGYGLGLTLHICLVNLAIHFTGIKPATYAALAVIAIVGCVTACRPRDVPRSSEDLPFKELLLVMVLASAAFMLALIWQLQSRDDDFAVHWPLVALFQKNNFPPHRPQFPDLPYTGHYGKDLCVASLSILCGEDFHDFQYFFVALNHLAGVCLLYLLARRILRAFLPALSGTVFAYLGVHSELRGGLLETFQNNNTLVYLFLFLNIFLLARCLRGGTSLDTLLCGISLGTYSLVYETHFCVLIGALVATMAVAFVRQKEPCREALSKIIAILAIALLLALTQGGTLTNVLRRSTLRFEAASSEDLATWPQKLNIHFPKAGLRLTSYRGGDYAIFSSQLVGEAGTAVCFLPLCLPFFLIRRIYLGTLFTFVGFFAIAVPAAVDFGSYYNADCFRFLFLAGVSGAFAGGIVVGFLLESAPAFSKVARLALALLLGPAAAYLFAPSISHAYGSFQGFWREPELHYWSSREWAVKGPPGCQSVDLMAAAIIRDLAQPGDRMLTTFDFQTATPRSTATLSRESVLSSFFGLYIVGTGLRVEANDESSMLMSNYEGASLTKIAFLHTGDVQMLRPLGIRFLYVDPLSLQPVVFQRLREEPRLDLVAEVHSGLEERWIWQVRAAGAKEGYTKRPLVVRQLEVPKVLRPAEFCRVPIEVETDADLDVYRPLVSYRILYKGKRVNPNDNVSQVLQLHLIADRVWRGDLYLVAPYEQGAFGFQLWQKLDDGPLRQARETSGGVFRCQLDVLDPIHLY